MRRFPVEIFTTVHACISKFICHSCYFSKIQTFINFLSETHFSLHDSRVTNAFRSFDIKLWLGGRDVVGFYLNNRAFLSRNYRLIVARGNSETKTEHCRYCSPLNFPCGDLKTENFQGEIKFDCTKNNFVFQLFSRKYIQNKN